MAMTSEREKEIRKIAGRDGQTWRSSAVSLVALNDVLDELDEFRGKARWIPVGERLPESEVRVLTWVKGQEPLNGEYLNGVWLTYGDWSRVRMVIQPTHWMPMPEPPVADESLTKVPIQHFHDDPVFYGNCPACVAGHAGVFVGEKGADRKCEARWDGGRTSDCEVFPSQFKYPHCQVCGQHHEPPACTASQ